MQRLVVGGGVAGTSCAGMLARLCPNDSVTLIAPSNTHVIGLDYVTRRVMGIEVASESAADVAHLGGYSFVQGNVSSIDVDNKHVVLQDGRRIPFSTLCICSGARPRTLPNTSPDLVRVLRDHGSIQDLASTLASASRVMVVGNGGIALELVYVTQYMQQLVSHTNTHSAALSDKNVVWSMKHGHAGDAFFDLDAASFLLTRMQELRNATATTGAAHPEDSVHSSSTHSDSFRNDSLSSTDAHSPSFVMCQGRRHGVFGHAVGPQWTRELIEGTVLGKDDPKELVLEYGTVVRAVERVVDSLASPVVVTLDNGNIHEIDVVVAAIGVEPNTAWLPAAVVRAPDGGILVNRCMQSSVPSIYAAGDCASVGFVDACPQWFQMRLWEQARTMGLYAAHCMAGRANALMCGFNFELFTHVTRFAGQKVVLLGLYNGQKLDNEPDTDLVTYARATEGPGGTFVRVLLLRGRMQGAVLIGDTGLEEVCENLILSGLDLSPWGPGLLDPNTDLADLFD